MRSGLQNWIFGCDICQDVCPWNRFSHETDEERFQPRPENLSPNLEELAEISPEEFKDRYRGSPIKRPKHAGLMRNVKAALLNYKDTKSKKN
jgi:epoxyqueuosine reductase